MVGQNSSRFLRLSGYLDESHKINGVRLPWDHQGTTDALETNSVMNVKVINLPYMIHIGTETNTDNTKTFYLRYLESVNWKSH
jgi:hypothetical protein